MVKGREEEQACRTSWLQNPRNLGDTLAWRFNGTENVRHYNDVERGILERKTFRVAFNKLHLTIGP